MHLAESRLTALLLLMIRRGTPAAAIAAAGASAAFFAADYALADAPTIPAPIRRAISARAGMQAWLPTFLPGSGWKVSRWTISTFRGAPVLDVTFTREAKTMSWHVIDWRTTGSHDSCPEFVKKQITQEEYKRFVMNGHEISGLIENRGMGASTCFGETSVGAFADYAPNFPRSLSDVARTAVSARFARSR